MSGLAADPGTSRPRPCLPGALLRYSIAWLAPCAVATAVLVAVLRPDEPDTSLPPVRQIQLEQAARSAKCELRSGRATGRLNPPADGRAGVAARPGAYDRPLGRDVLIGALRQGLVVIQYRPGVADEALETLKALRAAVPQGTILVPNATAMPYEIAVIAWRRLLGCPRIERGAVDAVRLFRGRFIGSRP